MLIPIGPTTALGREHIRTGGGVGHVIVTPRRVVDAVLAAATAPAFERRELREEPLVVEQFDAAGIHQWQQFPIQLRGGQLGGLIPDAELAELLAWPFPCIAVPVDGRDAVGLQRRHEFGDDRFGTEGRLPLT